MKFALLVALLSSVLVAECGISLGDLDQYVINYKVTVSNSAKQPAAVSVTVADKQRRVTLAPGASVEVISFRPGAWFISIEGTTGRLSVLRARRDSMLKTLNSMKNPNSSAYEDLDDALDDVEEALENSFSDSIGSGTCAGRMDDRAGEELVLNVNFDEGARADQVSWHC